MHNIGTKEEMVMALVAAKCTECGAAIEVDESKEAGICRYCGTAFITEKAINNYQSTVINNYAGATIVQEDGLQKLLNAVEGHRRFKDWDALEKTCKILISEYPLNAEGWWGLACVRIEDRIRHHQYLIDEKLKDPKKTCGPNYTWCYDVWEQNQHGIFHNCYPEIIKDLQMQLKKWTDLSSENLSKAYELAGEEKKKEIDTEIQKYQQIVNSQAKYIADDLNAVTTAYRQFIINFNNKFPTINHLADFFDHKDWSSYGGVRPVVFKEKKRKRLCLERGNSYYLIDSIDPQTLTFHVYQSYYVRNNSKGITKEYFNSNLSFSIGNLEDDCIYIISKPLDPKVDDTPEMKRIPRVVYSNVNKKDGCYVATCVYGSYDCPQVWVLRRFRDEYLAKNWFGRAFISTYYAISPTIVRIFGDLSIFKNFWKMVLDKWTNFLRKRGYSDTPYQDKPE